MPNLKIRCSALGQVMTDGKSVITEKQLETINELFKKEKLTEKQKETLDKLMYKRDNPELSETCKAHILERYVSIKYGRSKEIVNKYITKGLQVEEDSLTLYALSVGKFIRKNEKNYSNEFITGTPDTVEPLVDVKSSWDLWTFHKAKQKIHEAYYWQLQGYMSLTKQFQSVLAYCLIDCPEPLIQQEEKKLKYKMGADDNDPLYIEACEALRRELTFKDIPMEERIYKITIDRNDADIRKIEERVKQCREYFKSLYEG